MTAEEPWKDESLLRELYHDEKLSQYEIAERWDCSRSTVSKWMDIHGIPTRPQSAAVATALPHPKLKSNNRGYEIIETRVQTERAQFLIHRLLAVAEWRFDDVAGKVVHHQNGIPWDNRPGNIELLSDGEHKRVHAKQAVREQGKFARFPAVEEVNH